MESEANKIVNFMLEKIKTYEIEKNKSRNIFSKNDVKIAIEYMKKLLENAPDDNGKLSCSSIQILMQLALISKNNENLANMEKIYKTLEPSFISLPRIFSSKTSNINIVEFFQNTAKQFFLNKAEMQKKILEEKYDVNFLLLGNISNNNELFESKNSF